MRLAGSPVLRLQEIGPTLPTKDVIVLSPYLAPKNVRFGSKADLMPTSANVRLVPEAGMNKFGGDLSLLTAKHQLSCRAFQARKRKARHKAGLEDVFKACVKSLAT